MICLENKSKMPRVANQTLVDTRLEKKKIGTSEVFAREKRLVDRSCECDWSFFLAYLGKTNKCSGRGCLQLIILDFFAVTT